MAKKKAEQLGLDGVPQAPKRVIIDEIEGLCDDRDKLAGKRTAISDKIAEVGEQIQLALIAHKLAVYTYEDANGVLQDVFAEPKLRRVKSKLNPKKSKKGEE